MTTTGSRKALVDSNILVFAIDQTARLHSAARSLLERGRAGDLQLCVAPQNILEFATVTTNPRRVRAPISMAQAWIEIANFRRICRLAHPPTELIDRIQALVPIVKPKDVELYDLAIGVVALANGIDTIYTDDDAVFTRIPGLTVLSP